MQTVQPVSIGPQLTFDHPDECFIESLLRLELFESAIETCRSRSKLALNTQPDAAAQWAILEMHAVAAKTAADPTIIDEPSYSAKLLTANLAILERNLESPRLFWLKQQQQWSRWLVLRRLQAAYIAVPARTSIRDWSLATIRECLSELESLQSEVQKAPARGNKSNTKSVTTPEQWASLTNDIVLLQTDFLFLRALYYPAKSTERIGAASEILSAIEKAELRIGTDRQGRPNLDLAKYAALIHLDRPKDALDGIKALDKQLNTTSTTDGKPRQGNRWQIRIATLAAEANRNLGNISESNRWLENAGGWTTAPELAIEHFANIVSAAEGQSTSDSNLAQALRVKEEIGHRFGSYWQQRADAILLANNNPVNTSSSGTSTSPASSLKVELLKSEAKQLLAAKRTDEAIEKLNQAEISAASSENDAVALEMAIAAAAVLDRDGRKEEAEGEFHRAAISYSKQSKAPDCAMLSVMGFVKAMSFDATGRTLSQEEEAAELKQQVYRGRLMDIVNTWPSSSQATQALLKLDRLFLATDQIPELLSLWIKRLDQAAMMQANPENRHKQTLEYEQAFSRFALIATTTQDAWYDRTLYTSDTMKRTRPFLDALKAKLIERAGTNDSSEVRRILDWIPEASRWPNVSTAAQNIRPKESPLNASVALLSPIANQNGSVGLTELYDAFDGAKLDATSSLAIKWCATELTFQRMIQNGADKPIAKSELEQCLFCVNQLAESASQVSTVIGKLQSTQLGRCLKLYRVAIAIWGGNASIELETIKNAIASEPKAPWWKYRSARLYQSLAAQREQALIHYRQLASGLSPGSESWFDVRARTAQTLRQIGETAKAKELTEIVFATYPSATKEWQARFER